MSAEIPDKLFFRIGEVAKIASLRPSVLRYWETEFKALTPVKSRTGQRLYTKKEVQLVVEIKKLLYTEKLTIEGARKKIDSRGRCQELNSAELETTPGGIRKKINEIREDLIQIRNSL